MTAVAAWPMQMLPEELSLVLALAVVPGRKPMPAEQFLREFGVADGLSWGWTFCGTPLTGATRWTWDWL